MNVIQIHNTSASMRAAELLITGLIANEDQLEILIEGKRALVSFYKGTHMVWIEGDEEIVEIWDSGHGVNDRRSIRGAVMQSYFERTPVMEGREKEAQVIFKYLSLLMPFDSYESYIKIIIHKEGRNGVIRDGKILLSS